MLKCCSDYKFHGTSFIEFQWSFIEFQWSFIEFQWSFIEFQWIEEEHSRIIQHNNTPNMNTFSPTKTNMQNFSSTYKHEQIYAKRF